MINETGKATLYPPVSMAPMPQIPASKLTSTKGTSENASNEKPKKRLVLGIDVLGDVRKVPGTLDTISKADTADVAGIQVGFAPKAGSVMGIQAGALATQAGSEVMGLQASPIVNYSNDVTGVQVSFLNIALKVEGLQMNYPAFWETDNKPLDAIKEHSSFEESFPGVGYGVTTYSYDKTTGHIRSYKIPLVASNFALEAYGAQVGAMNICGEMNGVQVGLVSIYYEDRNEDNYKKEYTYDSQISKYTGYYENSEGMDLKNRTLIFGCNVSTVELNGAQIGAFNRSGKMQGAQVAIVNAQDLKYTGHSKGYRNYTNPSDNVKWDDKDTIISRGVVSGLNWADETTGLQFGAANITTKDLNGVQAGITAVIEAKEGSGGVYGQLFSRSLMLPVTVLNSVGGTITTGAQLGMINYAHGINKGLQVGLINYAGKFESGLQLGVINVTGNAKQLVQIGALNCIDSNPQLSQVLPLGNISTGLL